jgi:hypothetical protein
MMTRHEDKGQDENENSGSMKPLSGSTTREQQRRRKKVEANKT